MVQHAELEVWAKTFELNAASCPWQRSSGDAAMPLYQCSPEEQHLPGHATGAVATPQNDQRCETVHAPASEQFAPEHSQCNALHATHMTALSTHRQQTSFEMHATRRHHAPLPLLPGPTSSAHDSMRSNSHFHDDAQSVSA